METQIRQQIEEILGPMYCPGDYGCSEPGVEQYGVDGQTRFVVCIDSSDPAACSLAVPRAGRHECRCVLRATLLEKLH